MKVKEIYKHEWFLRSIVGVVSFLLLMSVARTITIDEKRMVSSFYIVSNDYGIDFYSEDKDSCRFIELYFETFIKSQIKEKNFTYISNKEFIEQEFAIEVHINSFDNISRTVYFKQENIAWNNSEGYRLINLSKIRKAIDDIDENYYIPEIVKIYNDENGIRYIIDDVYFGDFSEIIDMFMKKR